MTTQLLTPRMRANFRCLYLDILWFGVLSGSTIAFLAVYIARLGASAFEVSLLTAGPGLVNLAFSLPSGRWLEGKGLIGASFWSAILHRLGYLLLIPLPWLFLPQLEIQAVILITVLMSIPGTLLAIAFNAMFADVVPAEWRSEVVGKRNALMALSLMATTLICGQLLDRIPSPLNYQIVFALGAVGAALSTYYLGRIQPPAAVPQRLWRPLGDYARPGLPRFADAMRLTVGLRFLTRASGTALLRPDLLRTSFGPFLFAYLFFYTAQYLPVPLFPLAFVNILELPDSVIALGTGLFHAGVLFLSLWLRRLAVRFSHKRMLVTGALGYSIYPLMIGLAHSVAVYLVASVVAGLVWGLAGAAITNRLMEKVPENERPASMALHNLALNLGILAGSLSGPVLGDALGIPTALFIAAMLRAAAALLLALWG